MDIYLIEMNSSKSVNVNKILYYMKSILGLNNKNVEVDFGGY